jgi:hypothetical protein
MPRQRRGLYIKVHHGSAVFFAIFDLPSSLLRLFSSFLLPSPLPLLCPLPSPSPPSLFLLLDLLVYCFMPPRHCCHCYWLCRRHCSCPHQCHCYPQPPSSPPPPPPPLPPLPTTAAVTTATVMLATATVLNTAHSTALATTLATTLPNAATTTTALALAIATAPWPPILPCATTSSNPPSRLQSPPC